MIAFAVLAFVARQNVVVTPPVNPPSPIQAVEPERVEMPNEAAFFDDAAATAWKQFDRLWIARTGLAKATPDYARLTPWDIGSVIAATYSAHGLGLIQDDDYYKRIGTTLKTLETMPLYRKAVFHKMYFAYNAKMVSRGGAVTSTGYGWSGTDLGRLLVWLRIIRENEPQLRDDVDRIVKRIRFSETTKNGYMVGGLLGTHGKLWTWQEGRIGYEQYAAEGYKYFGAAVDSALDVTKNAKPTTVLGVPVLADKRGLDRLNSEPFVLLGMEIGFKQPQMAELARNVLAAQEARYKKTGQLTMVSEDAVSVPPYYFYYYCVLCNGEPFVVDVAETGKKLNSPRWVSTKASFGYHALMGTEYTRDVMMKIGNAKSSAGWSSGIFEKTGKSTNTPDINTAAVVLEAALYRKTGRPFVMMRMMR